MKTFLEKYCGLNDKGVQFASNGDYKEAINLFNKAIKIDSLREEAYANLANTYDDLNQHQKAIEFYDKAISINPKNASHYFNLGIIYNNLGNQELIDLSNLDKPNYIGQVADNKDNATLNFLKAAYLGDKEALSILNKVGIDISDTAMLMDNLLEIAYDKKIKYEDYVSAKNIFNFLLHNENNNISALLGISLCNYQLGLESDQKMEYENALVFYEQSSKYCLQLLNIEPKNKDASNILGLSYYATGGIYMNFNNHTNAIEYLEKSKILIKEHKEIVLELLAKAYFYNEQNDKAEETLRELSLLRGKDESTILDESKETKYFKLLVKGNQYNFNNNWEKAFEFYDKAIALIPTKQDAYYNKGKCYEHKGDFSEALNILRQALEIEPNGGYSSTILEDVEIINAKKKKQ